MPAKLRQDLKPTLIANWKVWVPFQFINFRFVPQSMQVRTPLPISPPCLGLLGTHMLDGNLLARQVFNVPKYA